MRTQKEGQVFSSDFLVGVIVLLFILTALQVYHSNLLDRMEHQRKLLYRESLLSKTDTLILSEGLPENWNTSNIEVLGFSAGEPNHLNETKLGRFIKLSADKAKELLGIEGQDYYFEVVTSEGDEILGGRRASEPAAYLAVSETNLIESFNESDITWDFYWCSSNAVPSNDARNVYQTDNVRECFAWMIENRSSYNSMTAEDPDIDNDGFQNDQILNDTHRQWFKNYVEEGGNYIQAERGSVICIFNMSGCEYDPNDQGNVTDTTYLTNLSEGDQVEFSDAVIGLKQEPDDNELTIMIEDYAEEGRALSGFWDYGSGRLIYITDNSLVNGQELANIFSFLKATLTKGTKNWGSAENVYTVKRKVLLEESGKKAILRLVVW